MRFHTLRKERKLQAYESKVLRKHMDVKEFNLMEKSGYYITESSVTHLVLLS
jgi:hypothetical protein